MKVTPFTRDLLKAYREEKAKQKQQAEQQSNESALPVNQ